MTVRTYNTLGDIENESLSGTIAYCKNICPDFMKCLLARTEELNFKWDTSFRRMYHKRRHDALIRFSQQKMTAEQYKDELMYLKNLKREYILKTEKN